jgi:hypothetical protein
MYAPQPNEMKANNKLHEVLMPTIRVLAVARING